MLSHGRLGRSTGRGIGVLKVQNLGLGGRGAWHGRGVVGGGMWGSLWNFAKPLLSKAINVFGSAAASPVGKQVIASVKDNAIKSGVKIVDDVLKGENVGQSLKKNLSDSAKNTLSEGSNIVSQGLFPMKKNVVKPTAQKRQRSKTPLTKRKRNIAGIKRAKRDLFS